MNLATLLLLCLASVLCLCYRSKKLRIRRNGKPLRTPANTLPLIGNGIVFLQARQELFSWFTKCEQQFAFETFQISVPSLPPGVVINNPTNLEFVLKNDGMLFGKGEFFKKRSRDLFGHGIINADGSAWKVQRKAGLHFLSNANLKILIDEILPKYLDDAVGRLTGKGGEEVIDLDEVLLELTTQIMGNMAYGMEMSTSDPFSKAFDFASAFTAERFQNPLWEITEPFRGRRFGEAIAIIKSFGTRIVANAIISRNEDPLSNTSAAVSNAADSRSSSLIDSLLDAIDNHQLVADAALNYLSAGRDTVAQALTWTFYLLMRNPQVVSNIRVELATENAAHVDGKNYASLAPSALPYTHAVFLESLRLYPPIPFEIRQCHQSTTLPDGTYLPKSTILVWCTWAINRSSRIWGDEAHLFRPGRWLHADEAGRTTISTRTAWEFPVFNGGPRMCLGKKMAEEISVRVIARLVESFNFIDADGGNERKSRNSLTLPIEGGLPCFVKTME